MTSKTEKDELIGRVIGGRYRVEALLGQGATATVYRAVQPDGGEPVALKVRNHKRNRRLGAARFHREAKVIQRLDHPGCVRMIDWGNDGDLLFIAMELVAGHDLYEELLGHGRMSEARAVAISAELCDALAAAHALGVIHRDLKPRNIMLVPSERPGGGERIKILDFGLAKLFRIPGDSEDTVPEDLTRPEATLGTPSYMAPEQIRQIHVDARADIYALGVVLYQMLTGRTPISGLNPVSVILKLASEAPVPPSAIVESIDSELEAAVMRCLEKSPDRRFPSALALKSELLRIQERFEQDAEEKPTEVRRFDDEEEPERETTLYRPGHQEEGLPRVHDGPEETTDTKPTRVYAPAGQVATLDGPTSDAPTLLHGKSAAPPKAIPATRQPLITEPLTFSTHTGKIRPIDETTVPLPVQRFDDPSSESLEYLTDWKAPPRPQRLTTWLVTLCVLFAITWLALWLLEN